MALEESPAVQVVPGLQEALQHVYYQHHVGHDVPSGPSQYRYNLSPKGPDFKGPDRPFPRADRVRVRSVGTKQGTPISWGPFSVG